MIFRRKSLKNALFFHSNKYLFLYAFLVITSSSTLYHFLLSHLQCQSLSTICLASTPLIEFLKFFKVCPFTLLFVSGMGTNTVICRMRDLSIPVLPRLNPEYKFQRSIALVVVSILSFKNASFNKLAFVGLARN